MSSSNAFFDVEVDGHLGILRLKPYQGVALADLSYGHEVREAIRKFEADGQTVLLVDSPAGNFAPERMDAFWGEAKSAPVEIPWSAARYAEGIDAPLSVRRVESGVCQLLETLQSVNLFKVISIQGAVDFDLLGLLLAFDVRICSKTASFENRTLTRGVSPGFGVVWYLAKHLGYPKTVDLVLNQESISAEELHRLGLLTQLTEEANIQADSRKYAQTLAGRSPAVLRSLVHSRRHLECDFKQYLNEIGAGFLKLPPA